MALIPVHFVHPSGCCSCQHARKTSCSNPGKHPRQKEWQTKGTTKASEIRKWFLDWPMGNYGVVTGAASGGLIVLDFDKKSGGMETLNQLCRDDETLKAAMLSTFRVRTPGGGVHVYFRMPPMTSFANAQAVLPGFDIRAEGGQAVGPGSKRPEGAYVVSGEWPAEGLPELPPQIVQILKQAPPVDRRGIEEGQKKDRSGIEENGMKGPLPHSAAKTAAQSMEIANWPRAANTAPAALQRIDLSELADSEINQRHIRQTLNATLPTEASTRHKQVFRLAQQLRSFSDDWWNGNPQDLKPLVKRWYEMAQAQAKEIGFVIEGSFVETWGEFLTAWPKVRTKAGRVLLNVCIEAGNILQKGQLPLPVAECVSQLGYDDCRYTALVLICWSLSQHWPEGSFPLSCEQAKRAVRMTLEEESDEQLSVNTPWAGRALDLLVSEGVLLRTYKAPKGGRGKASRYSWAWTPQPTPPPSLDWL
jgi:hypothetical protein